MRWILYAGAAYIASWVILAWRLPGLLTARATGVITRRGHRPVRIERAIERERFDGLLLRRYLELAIPAAVAVGGTLLIVVLLIVNAGQPGALWTWWNGDNRP